MPKAHVDEIDDISLEQGLHQGRLHEIELAKTLAYFVFPKDLEEEVENEAQQDVGGDRVDEVGEDSLDQNRRGILNFYESFSGESLEL